MGENNEESCGRHSLVHCSPADTHDEDENHEDHDHGDGIHSYIYRSSGYHHHHHVGDCDYVEDIDEDCYDFDETIDDHDDLGVTLVSVYYNFEPM